MSFPNPNNLPTDKEFEEARKRNTIAALKQSWDGMERTGPIKIKPLTPEEQTYWESEKAKGHEGLAKVDGFWIMPNVSEFGKWPTKHIASHALKLWNEEGTIKENFKQLTESKHYLKGGAW